MNDLEVSKVSGHASVGSCHSEFLGQTQCASKFNIFLSSNMPITEGSRDQPKSLPESESVQRQLEIPAS